MRQSKPHMLKRRLGLSLLYTETKLSSQTTVVMERGRRFLMSQKTARPLRRRREDTTLSLTCSHFGHTIPSVAVTSSQTVLHSLPHPTTLSLSTHTHTLTHHPHPHPHSAPSPSLSTHTLTLTQHSPTPSLSIHTLILTQHPHSHSAPSPSLSTLTLTLTHRFTSCFIRRILASRGQHFLLL